MSQLERTVRAVRRPFHKPRALRVRVTEGLDVDRSFVLSDSAEATLGTNGDADLVLTDATVSQYHLEIASTPFGVRLRDLGSLNGTYLDDVEIKEATVPLGAKVRVGQTTLVLEDAGAQRPRERPGDTSLPGLVAVSPSMRQVAEQVQRIAPTPVSVLLQGETGTGKEVIAESVHRASERSQAPFVVVDCGAIPANLIASELFGHEKGSFTGADRQRRGAFERAHGGTLFLDEIGELPLPLQPSLLGVLERRKFRRVGGEADIDVDVRVVSATHRDLRAEVNAGTFRADLYFRLAVTRIVIPPLRERPEDVEALVRFFLRQLTGSPDGVELSPRQIEELTRHRWSGNVRELRNVVESAVALGVWDLTHVGGYANSSGTPAALPEVARAWSGDEIPTYKDARAEALQAFEREYLTRLNERCSGNASAASRLAAMDRRYLLTLLRRHGLR
ncbi:MAG: sigma 54-dependent Fis family transcriptional regulator [Myxococcales bacterium]|nr:sigma 54-dependent Fis family transcriptional regulator [Myxococcales bacterium]